MAGGVSLVESCAHERPLTCGIDIVCTNCGLVLDTQPFDDTPGWDPNGFPELPREQPCSVRFRSELLWVLRGLGAPTEPGLLSSLAAGERPAGRLRFAAVARVYSHLRAEMPLEYLLDVLGISLHAAAPALRAEGVYDDEPVETLVGFALRRSGAPPEARRTCELLLRDFPSLSRRHLVGVALAEWVGDERSAWAVGLAPRGLREYNARVRRAAAAA
jgi:hypothetical protein